MVRSRSRRVVALAPAVALLLGSAALTGPVSAQGTKHKVGWCARTVSAAAAPFAIAAKLGWLKQEGSDVELVPMPGSTDCVKNVAVKEVDFSCRAWSRSRWAVRRESRPRSSTPRTRGTSTASPFQIGRAHV